MRKRMFIFCIAVLLTSGCTEKNVITEVPIDTKQIEDNRLIKEKVNQSLIADPAKFSFVANWLTDTKIVYVEKANDYYQVNSFDLESGQVATLYEDSSMIIDVLIHPSENYILLHTSNNNTSATIKVVAMDGTIKDEITVASTELEIEWNDMDPSLILLTAFHQDWTFDLFLYDGKNKGLDLLSIEEPFPKWLGKNKIVIGQVDGHILDGGEIHIYEPITGKWDQLDVHGVVYFDTYEDSILVVQINEDKDAYYKIMKTDGVVQSEWTMPVISNYSEWVIPKIEWNSSDTVFLPAPEMGGQLDELISPNRLIRVINGHQNVVVDNIGEGILRCSPSGNRCIAGYSTENLIDVDEKTETKWLIFPE